MGRFPRRKHQVPGLNLAALPDLIFTVLFFFMIVTHMRDVSPKVRYEVPRGTELRETANKSGVIYILIGKPVDAQGNVTSQDTRIQLNDRMVTVEEIPQQIANERSKMTESDRQNLVVTIRADRETDMGIINDVKQALRRAGALNINYSADMVNRGK